MNIHAHGSESGKILVVSLEKNQK